MQAPQKQTAQTIFRFTETPQISDLVYSVWADPGPGRRTLEWIDRNMKCHANPGSSPPTRRHFLLSAAAAVLATHTSSPFAAALSPAGGPLKIEAVDLL